MQQQEEPHDEEAQSRDGEPQSVIDEMRQAVVVSDFAHAEIGVAHVPDQNVVEQNAEYKIGQMRKDAIPSIPRDPRVRVAVNQTRTEKII